MSVKLIHLSCAKKHVQPRERLFSIEFCWIFIWVDTPQMVAEVVERLELYLVVVLKHLQYISM